MEKILVLLVDDSVGIILNEKILGKHYSNHKMKFSVILKIL
jgi:hypothetical protein